MLKAFVTVFSIPPAADTCAPTFHKLSTRSGNVLSWQSEFDLGLILLRALNFRDCRWTILWTIIGMLGDESSDSIRLNPLWRRLKTRICIIIIVITPRSSCRHNQICLYIFGTGKVNCCRQPEQFWTELKIIHPARRPKLEKFNKKKYLLVGTFYVKTYFRNTNSTFYFWK